MSRQPFKSDVCGDSGDVFAHAKQKARYGRFSWAVWRDRAGLWHAAKGNSESIKAAMLASGTAGHWYFFRCRSIVSSRIDWGQACIMFRNARRFGPGILN